jgi:hypothetical protein
MPFTFYYNKLPAGLGAALVSAQDRKSSFARRIELARVQLASQQLEVEKGRDLQNVEEWKWKRRATEQQMLQERDEKRQSLELERVKLGQQQGQFSAGLELDQRKLLQGQSQFAAGLELDQRKLLQGQSQFAAGLELDQRKLDLTQRRFTQEDNQVLLKEYNMLSKSGAVPYVQEKFDPAKHVEYVDIKNRMWMMSRQALQPQQVQAWVGFAKNKLGRLDGEMQYSSTKRKELLEAKADEERGLVAARKRVEDSRSEKLRARNETALRYQEQRVEGIDRELAGIRPAEAVRRDIEVWEQQYQTWIGMLPPEIQRVLLAAEPEPGGKGRDEAQGTESPEEYIRRLFGKSR